MVSLAARPAPANGTHKLEAPQPHHSEAIAAPRHDRKFREFLVSGRMSVREEDGGRYSGPGKTVEDVIAAEIDCINHGLALEVPRVYSADDDSLAEMGDICVWGPEPLRLAAVIMPRPGGIEVVRLDRGAPGTAEVDPATAIIPEQSAPDPEMFTFEEAHRALHAGSSERAFLATVGEVPIGLSRKGGETLGTFLARELATLATDPEADRDVAIFDASRLRAIVRQVPGEATVVVRLDEIGDMPPDGTLGPVEAPESSAPEPFVWTYLDYHGSSIHRRGMTLDEFIAPEIEDVPPGNDGSDEDRVFWHRGRVVAVVKPRPGEAPAVFWFDGAGVEAEEDPIAPEPSAPTVTHPWPRFLVQDEVGGICESSDGTLDSAIAAEVEDMTPGKVGDGERVVWHDGACKAVLRPQAGGPPEVVRLDGGDVPAASPSPPAARPKGVIEPQPAAKMPFLRTALTVTNPADPYPATVEVLILSDEVYEDDVTATADDLPELKTAGWNTHIMGGLRVYTRVLAG